MRIFLDHNSTTPLLQTSYDVMKPYFMEQFFNSIGIHEHCQKLSEEIEVARDDFKRLISKEAGEFIFTSSATESNNFIISQPMFHSIITTTIEHPSVLEPSKRYHKDTAEFIKVSADGLVDLNDLRTTLSKHSKKNNPILVSVQHANPVVHTIQPIKEIRAICKEYQIFLHVDATQTFGRLPLPAIDADFITISSHKCYGPKGIAGIWIKRNLMSSIRPLIYGGHQEFCLRAGTSNVPGIIGFAASAKTVNKEMENNRKHIDVLTRILWEKLQDAFQDIELNGSTARIPGGLHFSIPGIDSRSIILSLPEVIISTGMSCSSEESDPILKALGRASLIRSSFRLQIGFENTVEEIKTAADLLISKISQSRSFWGNKWCR